MRISALAAAAGVSVASVKYYLREGLLHAGEQTSATQARYDESHLARLRLIRALLDVGGLSVASTREVLGSLQSDDIYESLGRVQRELPPRVPDDVDVGPALELVEDLGWHVAADSPALRQLAVSMAAAERVGLPLTRERLTAYAEAAQRVAAQEVEGIPQSSPADALTYVVVGTVLYEPIMLALRRLAHQDVSARLFER